MKLTRFSKQIIAVVCAVAMVVAGLVFAPSKDSKASQSDAAAYDWSTVDWMGDANTGHANQFKFVVASGSASFVNIQNSFGTKAGLYTTFADAAFGDFTMNGETMTQGEDYAVQGAGVLLYCDAFEYKYSEVVVNGSNGQPKAIIYAYNKDGAEVETTTVDPSASTTSAEPTTTAEPTTKDPWVEIGGGTAKQWYYNDDTKQNISSVVNIQKPGFADETGIYITVPAGISEVNVNGNTSGVAGIQGAGAVVYLSALTKYTNEVTFTHGLGTSKITIRNTQGSDETTEAPTGETESTEAPTTTEAQVPGAPVGLVANLMQDNTVVYIAHGPASGTVTGYKYYIDDVENPDLYNGVNYPVSNFNPGQTYTLKVTAYNDAGEGPAATATFTIPLPAGYYNVADYKSTTTYTYPTQEGKIFAGWYTDDTCTTEYTETTGYAYAKFIDEKVLGTKFQVAEDGSAVRFLSSVDSMNYDQVGFKFTGTYGDAVITEKTKTTEKLYTKITAAGESVRPTVFSNESSYFFTYTVRGMTDAGTNSTWNVTPFYVTLDGTTVEGTPGEFPQN